MSESATDFIKRKEETFKKDLSKGRLVNMKDIGRKGAVGFLREAWTFMVQSNLDEKVFCIERLVKTKQTGKLVHKKSFKIGDIEYRIGYYIVGKNGIKKNRWTWGQSCPMIPKKDLNRLIAKAKKEKVII